jgi:hypothetical protein
MEYICSFQEEKKEIRAYCSSRVKKEIGDATGLSGALADAYLLYPL